MTIQRLLAFVAVTLAAPAFAAPAAEIFSLEGKGEFREASALDWKPVSVKLPLFPTNYVRTLEQSKMAILFADRTQMRLGQNSVMQIKEVAAGPDTKTTVDLQRGRSWTQSKTTPKGLVMETPSALAAIRGTDWEMIVDDDGRATLSVFSGEVEFYNDFGNVIVHPEEQARAERGKAPVKLQVQVSRERVQWVSSATVDPSRYAEFRKGASGDLAQVAGFVRERRLADAYAKLQAIAAAPGAPAVSFLLLADFEIYRGDAAKAHQILEKAAARFPSDERFEAALARTALLADDAEGAYAHARAALARRPGSAEAWIALGEVERRQGRAPQALAAYGKAVEASSEDARAWFGLGAVESERENVKRARADLVNAIRLDDTDAGYRAELGTLEGFAGNLDAGREELGRAIALQGDNYVALTGLGVLELKAGNTGAAMEALLQASLVEPRYARAHIYLAAAYYQARRDDAAIVELTRATEVDPKDPLPYLLMSIIHLDRIEPGYAVADAQQALARIPFLKSLNQVADNQKGIANVGTPLAFMGLEAWARSAAHESYLPFWGGSHLFLADRYSGEFDKRAELMQGFITDPMVFGESNRFQSLLGEPGFHGTLTMHANTSDDFRIFAPVLTLNGYGVSPIPASYFVEAVETRFEPGNSAIDGRMRTFTAAAGAKPTHELGLFIYASHVSVDADLGTRDASFEHIGGSATRVDAGMRYAFDAQSSLWIKAGAGAQDSPGDQRLTFQGPPVDLVRRLHSEYSPRANDIALRHTLVRDDALEITWGAEASRVKTSKSLIRDSAFHPDSFPVAQETLDQHDRDDSRTLYAMLRWGGPALRVDAGVAWSDYQKDRDILAHVASGDVPLTESFSRRKADPLLGVTWRMTPAMLTRAACRRWARPASPDTLVPIAVAGVPLDDQLVLDGGVLEQCRGQWEWAASERTFATVFAERVRVHNLVSRLDGVQNTGTDVTDLERLRNRASAPPPKPDLLEDTPVYGEGIARRAGFTAEHIFAPSLGVRAHYTFTDSENTASAFEGRLIPYLARHNLNLALTWAPGWRTFVTAQAVYRSERFADEANLARLSPGWDAQVNVHAETQDKRWAVEAFAANLLKKEFSDLFGIVVSYRF